MTERKVAGFELKRLDEQGQFVGRLARLNAIDRDGDVTLRGAFGNDQVAPVLVSHDWSQIPRGKAQIREEGDEVLAYGKINLALDAGRSLYEMLKFDMSHGKPETEFSYGFIAETVEPGLFEGQRVRFLKRVRVLEVSVVVAGAGDTALVAVKAAEGRDPRLEALLRLPQEEQQRWVEQAQALLAEAQFLELSMRSDDLLDDAGKALTGAFRYTFTTLPADDPRWRAACVGLKAAVAELRSTEPFLRFFTEALPGDQVDFISAHPLVGASGIPAYPNVVAVHENLSPEETFKTVAHEVCHVARPGLPEAKVEAFAREIARTHQPDVALVPVPVFVSAAEARELRQRKHQPVHYSPLLNVEFVWDLRAIPVQRGRPPTGGDGMPGDRLAPSSGRPMPGFPGSIP